LFFAFLLIFVTLLYLFNSLIIKTRKQYLIIFTSLCQSIKEAVINNEYVLLWMQRNPRSISFLKARFDTSIFSGLTLSLLTLIFVYVLALFVGVVEDLITSDTIVGADIRLAYLFFALRTDTLTNIFIWITLLAKSQVILVFIAISVSILVLWQKKYAILPLFIAVIGSRAFTYLGKLAFHRPRPKIAVYTEHSFSFPSGHATIAVAFYGFVGYLLMRFSQSWNSKVNIFFATLLIIIAIGFSRVYLGVHYISDVWSGYLIGAMWLIVAISFSEWLRTYSIYTTFPCLASGWLSKFSLMPWTPRFLRSAHLLSFVLIFIAILFYAGFSMNYHPSLALTPSNNTVVVSKSIDIFTKDQMKYTETLTGKKQEPVNFIFLAKNETQLVSTIQKAGWILTDKAGLSSFFKAVKALIVKTPHPSAPISPSFWNTKIQDISFAKISGLNWLSNTQHLRIWRTNFALKNGDHIYLGMVNANDGFKWGIIPKTAPDIDTQRERLYLDLNRSKKIGSHLKKQLVSPQMGKNFIGEPFFTDGKLYIISLNEGIR
jgi:undecaprenyl-diphosphatase